MDSNSQKLYATGFYLSAIAFTIGLFALLQSSRSDPSKTDRTPHPEPSTQEDPPAKKQIPVETNSTSTPRDTLQHDHLSDFEELLSLGIPVSANCFKYHGSGLTDVVVKLGYLSDEQEMLINASLYNRRIEILDLLEENAKYEILDNGELEIVCEQFEEQGARVRDATIDDFRKILNQSQFQLLAELSNEWKQLSSPMIGYGASKLTYRYSLYDSGDNIGFKVRRESDGQTNLGRASWKLLPDTFERNDANITQEYEQILTPELIDYLKNLRKSVSDEVNEAEQREPTS